MDTTREYTPSPLLSLTGRAPCRRRVDRREGAAVVELALVLPVLAGLIVGIIEIGGALHVEATLSEACRNGCAAACRPGGDNADVEAEVEAALASGGVPSDVATITILINDQAGNLAAAGANDKITITVEVPVDSVRLLGQSFFSFQSAVHSQTVTMLKQG